MAKKKNNHPKSKSGKIKAKESASQVSKKVGINTNAVNNEKTGWKTATVIIELLSDMCIGSGYSYAGIIDSDICYDEYGFPYIPSRRIKGCMRECAEEELYAVLRNSSTDIFGKPGADGEGGLILGDAVLKGIDVKKNEIRNLLMSGYNTYLTQEKVLSYYTEVRGQTKLLNGVAEENSLRFTRVLNKEEATVFEMPIMFKEEYYADIKNIIRALRHIGLHRNRGLGSVRCRMESASTQRRNRLIISDEKAGTRTRITYVVRNIAPLMLCNMEDNVSETKIRGQSLIGLLANRYLAYKDRTAEDQAFKDLFLNGQTIFSDAVPYHDGRAYYPVPLYINKLKKTSALVNVEYSANEIEKNGEIPEKYRTIDGNLPKKLSGYYYEEGSAADFLEIKRTLYHHHRHVNQKSGIKEQLYDMEAVSEGQRFIGTVECSSNYAKTIETLFRADQRTIGDQSVSVLRFGKSKTAQYGTCVLEKYNSKVIFEEEKKKNVLDVGKNQYIKVDFLSDAIFLDKYHNFAVEAHLIEEEVKRCIGISDTIDNKQIEADAIAPRPRQNNYYSILSTGEVAGYNGVWKTQKQPVPVVNAGSVLIFCNKEKCTVPDELRIGERCHEGFGHVRVSLMQNTGYVVNKISELQNSCHQTVPVVEPDKVKDIIKYVMEKELHEYVKIVAYYHEDLEVNSSLIGRINLMCQEALKSGANEEDKFQNFAKRVESIKTDSAKKRIEEKVLDKIGSYSDKDKMWLLDSNKISDLLKSNADEAKQVSKVICDYRNVFGANAEEILIKGLWRDYVASVLISQKYRNKDRGESGEETVNEEQSD